MNEAFEKASEIERTAISTLTNPADSTSAAAVNQNASLELGLIASRAEEISQLLPPDRIYQTEIYRIGTMLTADPQRLSEAAEYFQRAASGKNVSVSIAAWSNLAAVEFATSQPDPGREHFKRAITIVEEFHNKPVGGAGVALMKLQMYLSWARSEALFGDKAEAAAYLQKSRDIFDKLNSRLVPPFMPRLMGDVQATVEGRAPALPDNTLMPIAPGMLPAPSIH